MLLNRFQWFVLSLMVFLNSAHAADLYEEAWSRINNGALLVDVRTPGEFAGGHLDGAINIPYQDIVGGLAQGMIALDADIVLYCRSGRRSGKAQKALVAHGYTNTFNAGGYAQIMDRLLKQ
ncbi:rhodanese-like domain-containing protein [Endozoicomonas sp.]|uniref:rhodanese-like domain-containing protein n=1 Tax=Endozoicomonas sp. TaxID=1892382 RepID=UPI00383ABA22